VKSPRNNRAAGTLLAPALIVAAGLLGAWAARAGTAPSPVIYPPQVVPLTFDHAQHARLGLKCDGCHAAAATSVAASDDLIPGEVACRDCHKIDRTQPEKAVAKGEPAARCIACHVGWSGAQALAEPPRVRMPTPNLKFNHKVHVSREFGCELCHASVSMGGLATTADLPTMALCLGCHDGKQASARCAACHLTLPDGRLRVEFPVATAVGSTVPGVRKLAPSGSLRGFDAHTLGFRTNHKQAGRDEG
jgi:hypothetical protein